MKQQSQRGSETMSEQKHSNGGMTVKQFLFASAAIIAFMATPMVGLVSMVWSAEIEAVNTKIDTVEKISVSDRLRMVEATQKNTDRLESHTEAFIVYDRRADTYDREQQYIKGKLDQIITQGESMSRED